MPDYAPDAADVELVRNAWRNAPCPKCVEPRSWVGRGRNCRCVLDDDELRDYRARAVLSALAAAGRPHTGLLGVRTSDGRVYAPEDVVFIYPTTTEES